LEHALIQRELKIIVGIATTGRREQLSLSLKELGRQHRRPDRVVVCPASLEDCDDQVSGSLPFPVTVVHGPRGLSAQRNCIFDNCGDADVIVFFDDDFYPHLKYLAEVELLMATQADVVIATGHVLADGILGPGIEHHKAVPLLEAAIETPPHEAAIHETHNAYGCNMVVRMAPARKHGIRFDENLPLYSWLEDVDFSRQMAPYGRIVRNTRLLGVHLGTKRGRTSGVKFGYSQIANPIYMTRKGTLSLPLALCQMGRNVARNITRFIAPEPWVDRHGRLKGNMLALVDLALGRIDPRKILQLN
jgi:GT2 family glycosyltransferase